MVKQIQSEDMQKEFLSQRSPWRGERSFTTGEAARLGFVFAACLIGAIILFGGWYTITAGHRGVLLTLGKPDPMPKAEGFHFKIPLIQSVVKMDVRTQKFDAAKASAASKDLQIVTTDVTLNYYIQPDSVVDIYRKIGISYQDTIINPAVQEVVKAQTAIYTAEELITLRPEVKEKMDTALKDRLREFGIYVQAVSITNFDFSAEFNKAIEAKVTAQQSALAAKNKLEQIKFEAEQRVTQAKGEAEAIAIQVNAINQKGGQSYVQLQSIARWNGQLPTVMLGQGSTPFIDISSVMSTNNTQ